jgi:plastocyanin
MKNLILITTLAAALAIPAQAATPTLKGADGPGFTITLTQAGKKVTKLKAGTFRIVVSDKSSIHDFHLTGPGVNKATTVAGQSTVTWTVKLKRGKYTYVCDPHSTTMHGSFTVT